MVQFWGITVDLSKRASNASEFRFGEHAVHLGGQTRFKLKSESSQGTHRSAEEEMKGRGSWEKCVESVSMFFPIPLSLFRRFSTFDVLFRCVSALPVMNFSSSSHVY